MRIASNLVANAIRHTRTGAVRLVARAEGLHGIVEVSDTGDGMTEAEAAALVRPGARGVGSDGYGLGLAIVANLARAEGIGFDLVSAPGEGTRAILRMPLADAAPRQASA